MAASKKLLREQPVPAGGRFLVVGGWSGFIAAAVNDCKHNQNGVGQEYTGLRRLVNHSSRRS